MMPSTFGDFVLIPTRHGQQVAYMETHPKQTYLNSITFLNPTPIFEWCGFGPDLRTNTKETCFQKRLNLILFELNSQLIWEACTL